MDRIVQEKVYKVEGMHCRACENLIEMKIKNLPGVLSAKASKEKHEVFVTSCKMLPAVRHLNEIFARYDYYFFDTELKTSGLGKHAVQIQRLSN